MAKPTYETSVFINCPYDDDYRHLFHALVFAVEDCGLTARSALEADNAGEVRISKINRIIGECQHGIHDISRTELNSDNLPRFNMPLELGLFLGAREFGGKRHRTKNCLVLDREPGRYHKYCSDIAGQDVRTHGNDPLGAIAAVRAWVAIFREGVEILPGAKTIQRRYGAFQNDLPALCRPFHLDVEDLEFVELRTLAEEWVDAHSL